MANGNGGGSTFRMKLKFLNSLSFKIRVKLIRNINLSLTHDVMCSLIPRENEFPRK